MDSSDRLHLILATINAEKLLRAIDADSPAGPDGYLNLLVMLAIAVGMAERDRLVDCRRILSCAA